MDQERVKDIIKAWIQRMNEAETLPKDVATLNFGLYEPYGIELIGSACYDKEDDDWACEEDFVPMEEVALTSGLMTHITRKVWLKKWKLF